MGKDKDKEKNERIKKQMVENARKALEIINQNKEKNKREEREER